MILSLKFERSRHLTGVVESWKLHSYFYRSKINYNIVSKKDLSTVLCNCLNCCHLKTFGHTIFKNVPRQKHAQFVILRHYVGSSGHSTLILFRAIKDCASEFVRFKQFKLSTLTFLQIPEAINFFKFTLLL